MKQLTSINQRFTMFLVVIIALLLFVSAVTWSPQGNVDLKNRYNMTNLSYFDAFTMKGNLTMGNYNLSGAYNISADYFAGNGSGLTGVSATESDPYWTANQSSYYLVSNPFGFYNSTSPQTTFNWTGLYGYPVACAGSSAITQLNDSVTCSDLWIDIAGDTMTGNLNLGTNNITNISSIFATDWANVSITESQISDLQTYYLASNPFGFYNSTNPQTETDPLWTGNSTLVPYLASANVFTANQNLTTKNITAIDCIIFDSGGKICAGV